jgi:hypothetical protein
MVSLSLREQSERHMRSRRLGVMLVLLVCIGLGPIGMACNGCAAMGAMCGSPCALTSYALSAPYSPLSLSPLSLLYIKLSDPHPTTILEIPDPPPRSFSITA